MNQETILTLKRVEEDPLGPLPGSKYYSNPNPGGLRFAATPGYFLPTLRVG